MQTPSAPLNSTQIYRMLSRKAAHPERPDRLQALDLWNSMHTLPAGTLDAATRQPEDPPIT